jgi:transposase
MGRVVIGTDPHKRSATIEVRDEREVLLATGRFPMDKAGYRRLVGYVRQWPARVWAVEGANGAGRPLAARLLADGETVWDVPAKLAARVRVFDTGHGRKTDATDAHSIAMVALRTRGLRQLAVDEDLAVLRLLADRRGELSRARIRTLNRLHRLLAELVDGGAPRHLSVLQAKALLATVRPRDAAGRTRRALAAELIGEVEGLDGKLKALKRWLAEAVTAAGSGLMGLYGIGPAGAARILADVGDVTRFPDRNHFASWTGTAPLDASSGAQIRHRLSRAGNRRINHVLYIAGIVQIRHDTPGRRYYHRKLAEGKTPLEAMRCLRRRLSDVVYRQLAADAAKANQADHDQAGPGGQRGATTDSSAAGPTPTADPSDKPQPGPAATTLPTDQSPVLNPRRPRQLPHRADAPEASMWSAPPDESQPAQPRAQPPPNRPRALHPIARRGHIAGRS